MVCHQHDRQPLRAMNVPIRCCSTAKQAKFAISTSHSSIHLCHRWSGKWQRHTCHQFSFNDINGAKNGMGYKFTPAPAQPSKTFTVSVDGLMSSVGFLLSGYSGSFDPLVVRTPDNAQVSCPNNANDPNVLCLNLGFVQYMQVKVNGRKGVWSAVVSAGTTGTGTFSFSSIGASSITAESRATHPFHLPN